MAPSAKPTKPIQSSYSQRGDLNVTDARLFAPTFPRNSPPMIAQLAPWLAGRTGPVLEIGAGTGQHAAAFSLAFPNLNWWPSDIAPDHLASISAWQNALRAPVRPPLTLDAATDWATSAELRALTPLTAILSMNVIHIAPISVAKGIITGAGKSLDTNGLLIFYGPFRENGNHTGPGNISFDTSLRSQNPAWGIRDTVDVAKLAQSAGLTHVALIKMPANNRLLIFQKT